MAKLTDEQLLFLRSQGIALSKVFDASGLRQTVWKSRMKELGMLVAVGVAPCREAGHTLRSRAGHCIQCGTHNLAFLQRFDDYGYVYVAVSDARRFTKVGTASDVEGRQRTLRSLGYGGSTDWKIHFSKFLKSAGRIEFRAQEILAEYRAAASYVKEGNVVDCQELFLCTPAQAVDAVHTAVREISK